MAIVAETGQITSPAATGNQSYTFTGALNGRTPKCIIFFSCLANAAAEDNSISHFEMVGWTTGSTAAQNQCHQTTVEDGGASADVDSGFAEVSCINQFGGGTALQHVATLVTFDVDGFTLNWTTTTGAGEEFEYIAFDWDAGDDISVIAGNFDTGAGTGNLTVTGIGFTGKLGLFLMSRPDATPVTVSQVLNAGLSIGAAVSSSARWCRVYGAEDAAANQVCWEQIHDNRIAITWDDGAVKTTRCEMDFVSWASGEFTVNRVVNDASQTCSYLVFGGADLNVAVGTDTQKTSTGTQAKTGLGCQPQALILGGMGNTTLNSQGVEDVRAFFGVAGSVGDERSIAGSQTSASDPTETACKASATKIARYVSGATPTVVSEADLSSFDSGGYTLDWTTADAVARLFGFVALAAAAGGVTLVKKSELRGCSRGLERGMRH